MSVDRRIRVRALTIAGAVSLVVLIGIGWLLARPNTASPSNSIEAQTTISLSATPTSRWKSLLDMTPIAYTSRLPAAVQSPLDGIYVKHELSLPPQWWQCRRCADYRPAGGIWKLQFDEGVMRLFYETTGWRSIASFTVSGDRIRIFNDAYCKEAIGEFTWNIEGGNLRLHEISDECAFGLRAATLSMQPWIRCVSTDYQEAAYDTPGCAEPKAVTPAGPPDDLQITVSVHAGDSRFFDRPPDVFANANTSDSPALEGIELTAHELSIPYGLNQILWWNGDWIEASTDLPFTSFGVQFLGDPQIGWARVLLDGQEAWRGNTSEIWSGFGRHGGYVEFSNVPPGSHTIRVESLGFDFRPVTVARFGFSYVDGVQP